jgi:glycosyltransferase involved in cell wall biosynthesis
VTASLAAAAARHLRGCDALVSHFLVPSGLIAGALRAGRPHLAVCHGSDARVFTALPAAMRRRVLREATARWYVHPGLRDLVDPDDVNAVVSPMGAPRVPRADPGAPMPLRLAVVARLVAVKDVARAVDAVAAARLRGADVRLELVGEGPLAGDLRARARGLGDAVTFHGALAPDARDAVLARCHVLLHTARTLPDGRAEGAPLAVLESMAAGRCVVATASGGVAWMLGDGGVLLPEDASPACLADALLDLSDATRNALGERAMRRAEGWTWEAVAARVEATLR